MFFFYNNYITITMLAKLLDNVIYCIQLRLKCKESLKVIYKAIKALRSTIYCVQLNLNLFNQLYTPSTIVLKRLKALLPT
jgi:hypothetical protein